MVKRYSVREGCWAAWQENPLLNPGWGPSPIYIVAVVPMQSGKGLLRLDFIHALHPKHAISRSVLFRVISRGPSYVAGIYETGDGISRTVLVSEITLDWIKVYCRSLSARRPPHSNQPDEYLNRVLGTTEDEILKGATIDAWYDGRPPVLPERTSITTVGRTCANPLDSLLIARGFMARDMDDRWLIHMDCRNHLLFRRSWTGYIVYDVETEWLVDGF
jgi:hypothetical protein